MNVKVVYGARLCLCVLALVLTPSAFAQQDFPVKPIRIVVGVAAGGATDILARVLAIKLEREPSPAGDRR